MWVIYFDGNVVYASKKRSKAFSFARKLCNTANLRFVDEFGDQLYGFTYHPSNVKGQLIVQVMFDETQLVQHLFTSVGIKEATNFRKMNSSKWRDIDTQIYTNIWDELIENE